MSDSTKTFISYSWSTPEHEEWVLRLATQLVENGVDVILDKWHLREGDDSTAFMEKMVTDPEVTKVMMICDKAYAEKADKRKKGVGTETQIISPEVYSRVENNTKFVAIIREKDESGNPYVPTYLKNRIFIDLSNDDAETHNFEQLIRWIFDRPLHKRPELGKTPSYLLEDSSAVLGTGSKHRLALEAIKHNKSTSAGLLSDYFEVFAENLANLAIAPEQEENFADAIVAGIESSTPYRDELIDLFTAIGRYSNQPEIYREIHRFFELLLPLIGSKPLNKERWIEGENDNLRFFVHEAFLYLIAVLVKTEKFQEVSDLLTQTYFSQQLAQLEGLQSGAFDYSSFNRYFLHPHFKAAGYNNRRSAEAEFLRSRATRRDISFEDLMQADFLLYLYSVLHLDGIWAEFAWYPFTNAFTNYRAQPFEIFARARSTKYFERLKTVLSVESKDALIAIVEKSKTDDGFVPKFGFGHRLALEKLANLEKIASTP